MTTSTFCNNSIVTSVILSYNSKESLIQVIGAVKEQTLPVKKLIIVDNGSDDGTEPLLKSLLYDKLEFIFLNDNKGVGAGHNTGWRHVLRDPQCEFIWSLEHDCIPAPDCLQRLLEAYTEFNNQKKVGACVPREIAPDQLDKCPRYVWRKNRFMKVQILPVHTAPYVGRGFTFNGVLLPANTVREIGFLNAEFFIGHEDTDYSKRVREAGYTLLHVPSAAVHHDVLRTRKEIRLLYRIFLLPAGSVLRSYYETRNAIYLARVQQGLSRLLLQNLLKLPLSILFILCFGDTKIRRIQARLYAIRDGLRGDLGRKSYSFLRAL